MTHGARLGVYSTPDGQRYFKQLRRYHPDLASHWGTVKGTSIVELDSILEGSARVELERCGADRVGSAKELLGPQAKTNDLVVMWSEDGAPLVPFVAYTITRLLPLHRALEKGE